MRKVGMTNLAKAKGFYREHNWVQSLRYGELAATKLKLLKDRRLETVEAIDCALTCTFNALQRLDRHREAMECAKERYTLWAMNHMRNSGSIYAALALIQSCLHNKEYEDAERYARHAYFIIAEMTDNFIPADQLPRFLADGSYYLAVSIHGLAMVGGIPPEQKQKAGEEAVAFARKALEIHTQLRGSESADVAADMGTLADILDYFNDVNDDEVLRLRQQAIGIYRRVEGSSSVNVAIHQNNLGIVYLNRSRRAYLAKDMDRCITNLDLAESHLSEAARMFRANSQMDGAGDSHCNITAIEERIREIGIARAAAAAAAATKV